MNTRGLPSGLEQQREEERSRGGPGTQAQSLPHSPDPELSLLSLPQPHPFIIRHPQKGRSQLASPRSHGGLQLPWAFASLGLSGGSTHLILTVTPEGTDRITTIPLCKWRN